MKSFSVLEVADILSVREKQVIGLIHCGALAAFNISRNPGGRPTWRISEEELKRFTLSRLRTPPAPRAQRRRRQPEVVEFIK
jgi:hypothetical protein